jgi:hypothetical protein
VKIFVPSEEEHFRSLAHTVIAEQREEVSSAQETATEDFILNIDISVLPVSTFDMRVITSLRNLPLIPIAKRAPQLLLPNSIEWRVSVLAKRQALVFPVSQPR